MPQANQQESMMDHAKAMKMKKMMTLKKKKGGQQGFLNSSKTKGTAANKPGMPNHPNFRTKSQPNMKPSKKHKRGASNKTPTYDQISKSIKKTKGYT